VVPDPTGYQKLKALPIDGRSMLISRADAAISKPVYKVEDKAIENDGTTMVAEIPTTVLTKPGPDQPGGIQYRVDLCLFGGRCIPMQGFFRLR